ncbi:MAG: hypothetical protein OER87_07480 [Gammaproteobacteria bacterium]|nr:hypothetical protein [Gammaproteobacteria bacterium]
MSPLTLQRFADGINDYLKAHPDQADLPVVTSRDDEGNGFNLVYFDPSYGTWEVNADEIEGVCVS